MRSIVQETALAKSAELFGARAATDFSAAVEAADVDAVVVATPHGELSADRHGLP